ncbi:O-antigen ligase family protein [Planctomycetota bacterium]
MYPATLDEFGYGDLYNRWEVPEERSSDVPTAPVMSFLMLTVWAVICLLGFGVALLAKQPIVGIIMIAVPTFIGMVLKPTFALCILMMVLPTGAGVGLGQTFSLDRAIGLGVALSFFLNTILTRPGLHIRHRVIWIMLAYTCWIILASLAGAYFSEEVRRAFTQVQLLVLMFIVYWILETNGPATFRWALRSYVIGTLGTIALAIVTGASIRAASQTGDARFSATLGNAIDANMLAALTSTAFLAAIYLFARDRSWFWRLIYLTGILVLPFMMLRIGSRGALVALAFTVMSPLLFIRQVLRRPTLAVLLLLVIGLGALSSGLLVRGGGLDRSVAERLTDVGYAGESIRIRMEPIEAAVHAVLQRPIGTSFTGWFERSGVSLYPHNDFFLLLGVYGLPGAALFVVLILMMVLSIRRIPLGMEKLYARAVLTFLIVMGMNIGQVYKKYYWVSLAFVLAAERIGCFYTTEEQDEHVLHEQTPATTNDLSYVS